MTRKRQPTTPVDLRASLAVSVTASPRPVCGSPLWVTFGDHDPRQLAALVLAGLCSATETDRLQGVSADELAAADLAVCAPGLTQCAESKGAHLRVSA